MVPQSEEEYSIVSVIGCCHQTAELDMKSTVPRFPIPIYSSVYEGEPGWEEHAEEKIGKGPRPNAE